MRIMADKKPTGYSRPQIGLHWIAAVLIVAQFALHDPIMRTNGHEQVQVIKPDYATKRAQTAGVTREEFAWTLRLTIDGVAAWIYRDNERLIPIIVRALNDTEYGLIDHMTGSQTEAGFLSPSSKRTPYSGWRQATQQGYLEILETFRTPH